MPGSTRLHSSPLACGYALNERCYDASGTAATATELHHPLVRRTRSCCCCGCSGGCPDPSVTPPRVGLLEHRIYQSANVPGAGVLRVRRWRGRCVATGQGGRASAKTCRRQDAPTSPAYSRREGDWFGFEIGQNCAKCSGLPATHPSARRPSIRVRRRCRCPAGPWWQQLKDGPSGPVDHQGAGVGSRA
jgi:hypothetical protein